VALATCLGRTGAARHPRRRARLVLPGPSTRTLGPAATTQSSRGSSPDGRHTCRAATSCFSQLPCPSSRQRQGVPRGGLACLVGRVQPPAEAPPGQVRGRRSPAGSTRPPQRCPHPCLLGLSTEPLGGAGPHGTRLDPYPVVSAASLYRGVPHRHHPADAGTRRLRPDGLDTGRAGHRTGWTPDGRTAAPGQGSQMTGHWTLWTPDGGTAGSRTADRVGWTPNRGHRPAMDCRQASLVSRPLRQGPAAGMLSRSSAGQTPPGAISNPGQLSRRRPPRAWLPPRPDGCRVTLRSPAGALAHCSRVLELEGTRRGQWDNGKARVYWVRPVREC
jgi:hypothetical protein